MQTGPKLMKLAYHKLTVPSENFGKIFPKTWANSNLWVTT